MYTGYKVDRKSTS